MLAKFVMVVEVLEVGSVNSDANMLRNSTLHLFFRYFLFGKDFFVFSLIFHKTLRQPGFISSSFENSNGGNLSMERLDSVFNWMPFYFSILEIIHRIQE
jgi:hypothetical protein